MAQDRPYAYVRQISVTPIWPAHSDPVAYLGQPTMQVHIEASDTMNVSAQKETLSIRTQLSPPFPNHPQAMELAALIRVRDLLDAQIQAMQSP
jgi:hypothetical protein